MKKIALLCFILFLLYASHLISTGQIILFATFHEPLTIKTDMPMIVSHCHFYATGCDEEPMLNLQRARQAEGNIFIGNTWSGVTCNGEKISNYYLEQEE